MVKTRQIKHGTLLSPPFPHPILTPLNPILGPWRSVPLVRRYTATQYFPPGFVFFVVRRPLPLCDSTDSKEKAS